MHKFSKFIHGTATLFPDMVQAVPYWVDDESGGCVAFPKCCIAVVGCAVACATIRRIPSVCLSVNVFEQRITHQQAHCSF